MGIKALKIDSIGASSAPTQGSNPATPAAVLSQQANEDAVKVSLTSSQARVDANEERFRRAEEERQKMLENARKNLRAREVQFLSSYGNNPTELKFKVVEKESGKVVIEYPPD
ncbi:MAG: hypothetical protein IT292_11605 [Deltaproteobacteria bacterium]|nr:hypothetical protein [Deltaproteobacteria bacterium]